MLADNLQNLANRGHLTLLSLQVGGDGGFPVAVAKQNRPLAEL